MMYKIVLSFVFVDILSCVDSFTYSIPCVVNRLDAVIRRDSCRSQFRIVCNSVKHHDLLMKNPRKWDDEIDESTIRRVQSGQSSVGSGLGETAAGAVLGGLLLGPFGALFGASIGSNFGSRNAVNKAREEEMARLGLSEEMLGMANDIGSSLQNAYEGKTIIQDSLSTQQQFAKVLDQDATDLFDKAKVALTNDQEMIAKDLLLKRTTVQEKLKGVLIRCAEEKKRLILMEDNIQQLERRAMEIDALMRRSVSAKTIQQSSDLGLSLTREDPLLKKFKDLGID